MTYSKDELRLICDEDEVKFVKSFERFLKTHRHGGLQLFGHDTGTLNIIKYHDFGEGECMVSVFDTSSIVCSGGQADLGKGNGELIDIYEVIDILCDEVYGTEYDD